MKSTDNGRHRRCGSPRRRDFLKLPLAAGAAQALLQVGASGAVPHKDEYDPDNTKIASKVAVSTLTDDELLFLKQIGLRWVHAEFGNDGPYEFIKNTQERFASYGIKIHCGLLEA